MTENLAELLATRLRTLPFLERVVGLARPVDKLITETLENDKEQTRRTKTPEPLNFPADTADCDRTPEVYLLPDQAGASITFFEDGGTVEVVQQSVVFKESTLKLLGWFNPARFVGAFPENALLDAVLSKLPIRANETVGDYQGLRITAVVLPAEASLFGKYTYAADVTPLLYPPYRLLGLELKCRYFYRPECPVPAYPELIDLPICR